MIPYFSLTSFSLGPFTVYVWGVCVAVGFVVGAYAAAWMARRRGVNPEEIYALVPWLMLAGLVGGRLGHVFFYEPAYFLAHPLEIVALWNGGLSVYGGLLAACGVLAVHCAKRSMEQAVLLCDVLAFGLPFGKVFGRLGCFLIHDHPGTLTDFVLGVHYPDGTVRHDLGLYLMLDALVLSFIFIFLARKKHPQGMYLAVFALWYGGTRFFLDFLRVLDVRYGGLTPAQYLSLMLFFSGAAGLLWITRSVKTIENR